MEGINFRIRSLSWLSCLLFLGVLLLFNAVFARANMRLDLTEEKLYTLSKGSKAILTQLEDPVSLKVFWADVPTRFDYTKRYVEALLVEMENAGDGGVQVQWVDMDDDDGKAEATDLGIEQYVFVAGHGSEVRESKGYMSIAIELGDEKPAILNALSNIQDQLEYLIIATIFQRARVAPPIIGMVSDRPSNPFGGGAQQGRFGDFEATLHRAFGNAARTYLNLDAPIAEDVDVLILAAPRNLSEEQTYHLEQFLLRGGRAILLLDPVDIDNVFGPGAASAEPHSSGLEDWLEHLGVTVERGTVADFNESATCLFPRGREAVRYPYWPKMLTDNMDPHNPVTRNLAPMPMYWPAALAVDEEKQEAMGRTVTVLGTTTTDGYRRGDITALREAQETAAGKLLEQVPLMVMVEGPLKSFWLGKPVPGQAPALPEIPPSEGGDGAPAVGSPDGEEAAGSPDGEEAAGSPDGEETPVPGSEQPKPGAEPKGDEPKGDEPKGDEPKGDEPKGDEPKGDEPKGDEPKGEKPKGEKPKGDEPKGDEPKGEKPAGDGGDGEAGAAEPEAGPQRLEDGTVRLIIVGDAELICDQLGPRFPLSRAINGVTGFSFVANAAEWLSGSEELLELRARATNPRNLDQIEDDDRELIKDLNLWLVPLLVLLAGLTVFFVRKF